MRFWFRKEPAAGYRWSFYQGTLAEVSREALRLGVIRKGQRSHGCYDPKRRRVFVTGPGAIFHEWAHILFTVYGIADGHERRNGIGHKAIVALDEARRWTPARPPPLNERAPRLW